MAQPNTPEIERAHNMNWVAPEDSYVAYLRYVNHGQEEKSGADIITIEVCDSDAKGAFKVYPTTALTAARQDEREACVDIITQKADTFRPSGSFTRTMLLDLANKIRARKG